MHDGSIRGTSSAFVSSETPGARSMRLQTLSWNGNATKVWSDAKETFVARSWSDAKEIIPSPCHVTTSRHSHGYFV